MSETDETTQPVTAGLSKPNVNPWLIASLVSFVSFLEMLDTGVVNIALPHIARTFGASNSESIWVLTSYLVSSAIVLPITGSLVSVVGRRRLFLLSLAMFAAGSLLSGIAPTLGGLLFSRVIQGIGGGILPPITQAILADVFPPQQRGLGFALYGVLAVTAPVVGPTLGGWISDHHTWRFIFLMNLPFAIFAIVLVLAFVEDPTYPKLSAVGKRRLDYLGFGLLAAGAGFLQVVFDKWQEIVWFRPDFIRSFAVVSIVCLSAFVVWELRFKEPIVDIRLFRNPNFRISSLMMFIVGASSLSTIVLMSQFLENHLGYTAENAGLVLSAGSLVLILEMPLIGTLTSRIQVRYLIAFGWGTLALAMFFSARTLGPNILFGSLVWLRIAQYAPWGFLFVPLSVVAYERIPVEKSNALASLINLVRGMGSGLGTAAMVTMLAVRARVHQATLLSQTGIINAEFRDRTVLLATQLQEGAGKESQFQTYHRIYESMLYRAATLSYIDTFWLLGWVAAAMFFLSFLLEKNTPSGTRAG
jgi:DHA2 family multidrug resistance protein